MKQYIDKSAVVEEIERIKKEECPTDTYEGRCKLFWLEQFSSFLDTLEVKEVDGAEWADNHPKLTWKDIRKICLIAENVHKYYGFWSQNVYEEIFNRFYKPGIWS